jgi:GAF domain-containing protein
MLDLPDNREEKRFDRLTRVARRCLSAPVGLISLIEKDRPALMFCSGLNEKDASQVVSFCDCVVHSEEMLVVEDASADERFNANLLVTGVPFIRFYAGCPLRLPGGDIAGTLCVVDTRPRIPDGEELTLLKDIAALVEEEFYIISLALTDALTGVLNRRGFYKNVSPG